MSSKYVYLISTYDEYGAEGVRATLNREKLFDMLDYGWKRGVGYERGMLRGLLLLDDCELCETEDGFDLSDGWGGLKFYVIELR